MCPGRHPRPAQLIMNPLNQPVSGVHQQPIDDVPNGHAFHTTHSVKQLHQRTTDCRLTERPAWERGQVPPWRQAPRHGGCSQGSWRQGHTQKNTRVPWDAAPGDPRAVRYDTRRAGLDVVAPPLHVRQEPGEGGPVDNVCSPLRALAVANRGDTGQVGGHLNASSVVGA